MQQAVPRSSNLNKRTPLEVYSEYANHRRFPRNRLRLIVVEGGIDKHALLQMGVNRTDWKIESVGTRDNVEATVELFRDQGYEEVFGIVDRDEKPVRGEGRIFFSWPARDLELFLSQTPALQDALKEVSRDLTADMDGWVEYYESREIYPSYRIEKCWEEVWLNHILKNDQSRKEQGVTRDYFHREPDYWPWKDVDRFEPWPDDHGTLLRKLSRVGNLEVDYAEGLKRTGNGKHNLNLIVSALVHSIGMNEAERTVLRERLKLDGGEQRVTKIRSTILKRHLSGKILENHAPDIHKLIHRRRGRRR